jgi:hypothetical protein
VIAESGNLLDGVGKNKLRKPQKKPRGSTRNTLLSELNTKASIFEHYMHSTEAFSVSCRVAA